MKFKTIIPAILILAACAAVTGCKHDRTEEFTKYLTDQFNSKRCSLAVWLTPPSDFFSLGNEGPKFSRKFPSELDLRYENKKGTAFPLAKILEREGYITTEKVMIGYEPQDMFDKGRKKELWALRITPTKKAEPYVIKGEDAEAGLCLARVKLGPMSEEELTEGMQRERYRKDLEVHEVRYRAVWDEKKTVPETLINEIVEKYKNDWSGKVKTGRFPDQEDRKGTIIYDPKTKELRAD